MPDAPESVRSSDGSASSSGRTYAEVLSTSNAAVDGGDNIGVIRRRQLVRSQQHQQSHDNFYGGDEEDEDELFLFHESLRRGDAAQARRRLTAATAGPRRSLEATPAELSELTSQTRSTAVDVPNAPLLPRLSLPTIIHPPLESLPRSESPDELDMFNNDPGTARDSAASTEREDERPRSPALSGTSARRSDSIYAPATTGRSTLHTSATHGANALLVADDSLYINPERLGPNLIGTTRARASQDIAASLNALSSATADDDEDELAWLPQRTNALRHSIGSGKPVLLLYCGSAANHAQLDLPSSFYFLDADSRESDASNAGPSRLYSQTVKKEDEDPKKAAEESPRTGGGCGALVCARAAQTLDPHLLESDAPPRSATADWLDIKEDNQHDSHNMGGWRLWQNCGCVKANIGCTSW